MKEVIKVIMDIVSEVGTRKCPYCGGTMIPDPASIINGQNVFVCADCGRVAIEKGKVWISYDGGSCCEKLRE